MSALPILIFLAGFAVIIYVGSTIKKGSVPNIFGYSFMIVLTDSMEPTYKVDDFIVVKAKDNYYEEDVVTFLYDIDNNGVKELVSHRIQSIVENKYTMVGDNPATAGQSQIISKEDIIGKVVTKSTFLGSVLATPLFQNKGIIFAVITVLLIGFIIYQFINIVKITKNKD